MAQLEERVRPETGGFTGGFLESLAQLWRLSKRGFGGLAVEAPPPQPAQTLSMCAFDTLRRCGQ